MFRDGSATGVFSLHPILSFIAVGSAAGAAVILIWFLWKQPPFNATTKILLLLGLGVLPIGAAMSGNVVGFESTQQRQFCGSCHIMAPFVDLGRMRTVPIEGAARFSARRGAIHEPRNCWRRGSRR